MIRFYRVHDVHETSRDAYPQGTNPRLPPITKDGVLTIPKARPTEIGAAIRQFSASVSCDVIDFYSTMINHPEWQPDNLHPDPNGDFALAKTVYAALIGQAYDGGMILTTQRPRPKRWP